MKIVLSKMMWVGLALILICGSISIVSAGDNATGALKLASSAGHIEASQGADIVYHGNVKSKVFHRPGCRYYDCKNCAATFASRDEALNAGYRPCKVCNP